VARGYQRATATRTVDRCREPGYVGDEKLVTSARGPSAVAAPAA
jgi:hypothetical protein